MLNDIHEEAKKFFTEQQLPVPAPDILSRLISELFQTEKIYTYQHSMRYICFKNIEKYPSPSTYDTSVNIPSYCTFSFGNTHIQGIQIECPLTNCINGEPIKCIMKFMQKSFCTEINSGYGIPLNQQTIDSVLSLVQKLKLCIGNTCMFTNQSCVKEEWSLLHDENSMESRYRSQKCQVLLSLLSPSTCCRACSESYNNAKKRHEAKEEGEMIVKPQSEKLQPENFITLKEDDERDMNRAVPENLQTLLENQQEFKQ